MWYRCRDAVSSSIEAVKERYFEIVDHQENCLSGKLEYQSMLKKITFPEHEYGSVQKWLDRQGFCYTTRVYKEAGKYKVGESYLAPWGDVLKIDDVQTFSRVSDRPFFDEMSEEEKDEIRKYSEDIGLPYEFIRFSRSEDK